jgi:HK97 family phage major capsid protein
MLDSVRIQRRQSEIRQQLAELAAKPEPTEDEVRSMDSLDREYRSNETRYRAALIAEDTERRDAGAELETRSAAEWAELMAGFELRQVALALDEGRQLDGQTAEIVTELRSAGGFRGVPVPWQALELRNTVAAGTPDPIQTRPIIARLFPDSVASRMGAQMISIDAGAVEWPVTTSAVSAGWADGEVANVAGPTAYATTDRAMNPDHNLGIQMRISRRALKQSGAALEQAVRRDMNGAMGAAMDQAVFLGTGANGQPLGVVAGAATYGIMSSAVTYDPAQAPDIGRVWEAIRFAIVRFMTGNAAASPEAVRLMLRPELWGTMDGLFLPGTGVSEYDLMTRRVPAANIAFTNNGLPAPSGDPLATSALLTTAAGGVAPIFVGAWGAVDVIRDPFSDAQSGGLRITALATMDVTVARPAQLELLTGIRVAAI